MEQLQGIATILGSGTSQGVPVIGCHCPVCVSEDPKDQRLRASVLFSLNGYHVVVDAGPDFRQQMLKVKLEHLDALMLTHEHNDHVAGLDDVRPFNFRSRINLPVYCSQRVAEALYQRFAYAFGEDPYPGAPRLDVRIIERNEKLQIGDLCLEVLEADHGGLSVFGFRVGSLVYLTDVKRMEESQMLKVKGCEVLVINALHHQPHHSHFNLEEALAFIREIGPRQAYLTHVSHHMGLAAEVNPDLPEGVQLAYDGLELPFVL